MLLLSIAAIAIAVLLPPTYRSEATILIESPKIPQDLIRSTINNATNEQIEYISQRVLTSTRVLEVLRKFQLYDRNSGLSTSEAVNKFRKEVEVRQVLANIGRRQTATISFSIAFTADEPKTAQNVANELVTMFLTENVKSRSESAEQTTDFLSEEGEKIRATITNLEQSIAQFKQANSDKMPDVVDMNLKLMQRYESDYQNSTLELEEASALLKVLERQKSQYKTTSSGGTESLIEIKKLYNEFLVRNTENHPDATRMRRQIATMEQRMIENTRENSPGADSSQNLEETYTTSELLKDPGFATLIAEIGALQRKVRYFANSKRQLSKQLQELEARILEAPVVEQGYLDLQRDLDNLETKYQEIRNKELEAQISQNLEEDQKGERFRLLEGAGLPNAPESPDRLLILAGGLVFALGSGLFLVIVAEALSPGIRSTATFATELGSTPLITIPLFEETLEVPSYNTSSFFNAPFVLVIFSCALVGGMGLIHLFVIPIETLVPFSARLGG